MRLLAAAAVVATVGLSFGAGAAARLPIGGAIGGTLYAAVILVAFNAEDGMQVNGEYVCAPIGMAALFAVAWAMMRSQTQRSRYRLLACAGVLAALQGLTKQTALAAVGPFALWALVGEPLGETSNGLRKQLVAICAGWFGLLGVVVAIYAISGSLWDFVYYFWRYNLEIYMEPYRSASLRRMAIDLWAASPYLGSALVLTALGGPLLVLSRCASLRPRDMSSAYRTFGMEATAALEVSLMLLGAMMACRNWPHYWVTTIPFASLFIGILFERALGSANTLGSVLAHLLGPAALMAALAVPTTERLALFKKNHSVAPPAENPICVEVGKLSRPDDFIFIWGFDGDLYVDCHRRPASRFVFNTFQAGVVPPFWADPRPTRVAPRSRETLLRELTEKPVPLILDMPARLGGTSMTSVPMYATLLAEKYCPPKDVTGEGRSAKLYRSRAGGPCE
jgi:hypothetical protein